MVTKPNPLLPIRLKMTVESRTSPKLLKSITRWHSRNLKGMLLTWSLTGLGSEVISGPAEFLAMVGGSCREDLTALHLRMRSVKFPFRFILNGEAPARFLAFLGLRWMVLTWYCAVQLLVAVTASWRVIWQADTGDIKKKSKSGNNRALWRASDNSTVGRHPSFTSSLTYISMKWLCKFFMQKTILKSSIIGHSFLKS